jgi:hypothetical protein
MKPTIAERLETLAIKYANHRQALRDNAQAIRELHDDVDAYVDLKPYRNRYMSGEVTDDPECSIVWRGWLHAVVTCQDWDDETDLGEECAYRSMAMLLDNRKAINAGGAKIRNSLRVIGEQLLKVAP